MATLLSIATMAASFCGIQPDKATVMRLSLTPMPTGTNIASRLPTYPTAVAKAIGSHCIGVDRPSDLARKYVPADSTHQVAQTDNAAASNSTALIRAPGSRMS